MRPAHDPLNPLRPGFLGHRVVVAGFGLLTPLGQSAWETFTALLAGRTLADRCPALPDDVAPVDLVRAVGSIKLAHHAGDDPAVEIAERAAREACAMADVAPAGLPCFLGTSKGAVATLAAGGPAAPAARSRARDHALAVTLGPHGYLSTKLGHRLGLGASRHYVAACASSLTALHHARLWLASPAAPAADRPDSALVLTSEAALTPQFIHSYRRLGVLAPQSPVDYRQRPLDERRGGFMLSELGAAVVLRRLAPGETPEPGQIELVHTDALCEADDLIRPSDTMPALRRVAGPMLRECPGGLTMIHPHAPGTRDHDPNELRVYRDLLAPAAPDAPPPDLYASKGAVGHGLGAAGLTALVVACLCITAGRRPPMSWLNEPIPETTLRDHDGGDAIRHLPAARPTPRTGAHAVFAAGFAGHVAGALIRRW